LTSKILRAAVARQRDEKNRVTECGPHTAGDLMALDVREHLEVARQVHLVSGNRSKRRARQPADAWRLYP